MIVFPNAKINLGLQILEKRSDNYHNLASVFVPVNWCDILEVFEHSSDVFYLNGIEQAIDNRSNLVLKALDLLRKDYTIPPFGLYLEKIIPVGAGLGGGSSDASFALKLFNDYFHLGIATQKLEGYASQLGADCPFFIQNKPCLVTGIGDILTPLQDLNLSNLNILLINPNIHISTSEAYAGVNPLKRNDSMAEIISNHPKEWKKLGLSNDFEAHLFKKYPILDEIKKQLYVLGASYASMSGSGSTLFGIFEGEIPQMPNPNKWTMHYGKILQPKTKQ